MRDIPATPFQMPRGRRKPSRGVAGVAARVETRSPLSPIIRRRGAPAVPRDHSSGIADVPGLGAIVRVDMRARCARVVGLGNPLRILT